MATANSSIVNLENQVLVLQNNQEDGIGQEDLDDAYNTGYSDGSNESDNSEQFI